MAASTSPVVGATLVTRLRPALLAVALERLGAQSLPVHRLVVLNVQPDPETRSVVEAWGAHHPGTVVELVGVEENVGPAGAVGRATQVLLTDPSVELVLLLEDDDPLPSPGSLECLVSRLVDASARDAAVGGVGFHGAVLDRRRARLGRPSLGPDGFADVDYLAGGHCPLLRRAVLEEVGPYDERLFFGFEELEFGLRARAAGWRLLLVEGADEAMLPGGGTERRLGEWTWRRYYSLRNLLVVLRREGASWSALRVAVVRGIAKPVAALPTQPRLAIRHLRWNLRAILDAARPELGRTIDPPADP